jgi:hypothetical protein
VTTAVERITAQTRDIRPGLALLGIVAALLMWVGRIPAYLVTATVWCAVAVREGYREVRPAAQPSLVDAPRRSSARERT